MEKKKVCLFKLYLNSLYIIETSSGLPRESSEIFGHLREFSEILAKYLGTFVWPSEQFFGNLHKIIKNDVINMSIETLSTRTGDGDVDGTSA